MAIIAGHLSFAVKSGDPIVLSVERLYFTNVKKIVFHMAKLALIMAWRQGAHFEVDLRRIFDQYRLAIELLRYFFGRHL